MSLAMSFHSKVCPQLIAQFIARKGSHYLPKSSNIFARNFSTSKLAYISLKNGSSSLSILVKGSSLSISGSRHISFITPILSKTKPVLKKAQLYVTGFIMAFVIVYAVISFSVSTVVYELLKMQANSISIKDKSLDVEKKDN